MIVTYITHSCFLIETVRNYLLFDYFDGELPRLNPNKALICFASHSHADHFSEKLFEVTSSHTDVCYILSSDIFKSRIPSSISDKTFFVEPHSNLTVDGMEIFTLRSTDLGVAFVVKTDEGYVYHAGDFNNWQWDEESDSYNNKMERNYLSELKRLDKMTFYAAFIPYDSRQSQSIRLKAVLQFMQYATAENLFPMHMWEKYDIAKELTTVPLNTKLFVPHNKYESFNLKEI
jgi:L-ascorbate metabolism protein UlaG (beta-lactamase superfamily)